MSKHQIQQSECGEWAGWRGTGRPNPLARPHSEPRTGAEKISVFPVQLATSRIGNLARLICTPHTKYICDYCKYIHNSKEEAGGGSTRYPGLR